MSLRMRADMMLQHNESVIVARRAPNRQIMIDGRISYSQDVVAVSVVDGIRNYLGANNLTKYHGISMAMTLACLPASQAGRRIIQYRADINCNQLMQQRYDVAILSVDFNSTLYDGV